MKKLVIISIVFLITLGAMIGEVVFVNNYYSELQRDLEIVAQDIDEHEGNVNNAHTVKLCEDLRKKWEDGRAYLLTLQNHNTVRNFDDKIISLEAVVKSDNYNDAVIFVNSAINYIDDILLDSIPYISNIF